jgi:hypothetical protein
MSHTCHAQDCNVPVPPKMFMCRSHWYRLPKSYRDRVWATYMPGQEIRKDPTAAYMVASYEAIKWIAEKEGRVFDPSSQTVLDYYKTHGDNGVSPAAILAGFREWNDKEKPAHKTNNDSKQMKLF